MEEADLDPRNKNCSKSAKKNCRKLEETNVISSFTQKLLQQLHINSYIYQLSLFAFFGTLSQLLNPLDPDPNPHQDRIRMEADTDQGSGSALQLTRIHISSLKRAPEHLETCT